MYRRIRQFIGSRWQTNGPWLEIATLVKQLTWSVTAKIPEVSDHMHLIEISVLVGDTEP